MNTRPTVPSPHRHESDLRAFAWHNRLAGFGIGLIVASLWWLVIHFTFSP